MTWKPIGVVVMLAVLGDGAVQRADAQADPFFPPDVFVQRRARLAALARNAPIIVPGAYRIRDREPRQDPSFWYLTGIQSPYAVLVIAPGPTGIREALFLPEPYQFAGAQYPQDDDRFRHAAWNRPVQRLSPGPEVQRRTGIAESYPIDELLRHLSALVGDADTVLFTRDMSTLYVPSGLTAAHTYRQQLERAILERLPNISVADVTPLIDRLRLVKDPYEIAALRRAAEISVTGLVEAMRATRPGLRDLAIAGHMEWVWKREGAPRASFGPIVSSGPASISLYTLRSEAYDFDDRVMQDGDLLFVDYGAAEYQMYASDICRTFPVSGRFSPEQRRYYEIVLEAQDSALAVVQPGIMMTDVIRAAARVFRQHGLERFEDIGTMRPQRVWGIMPSPTYWLAHGGGLTDYSGARGTGVRDLGHHIGLDALDSRDYSRPLEPGMVFTVEPKLYIPDRNIAIMIEDVIVVTNDGYENLSAGAPRTVEAIERVMAGR